MEGLLNDNEYTTDFVKYMLTRKDSSVGQDVLFRVCKARNNSNHINDEIAIKMIDLICANGADIFSTDNDGKNIVEITNSPVLKEYIKQKQTKYIYNRICSDIKK